MIREDQIQVILAGMKKRNAKLLAEFKERTEKEEINFQRVAELLEKFSSNSLGVGVLEVLGTDPTIHTFFELMTDISKGKQSEKLRAALPCYAAMLNAETGAESKNDEFRTLFLGLLIGVYLSEIGLAHLVLRGDDR